ncbi:MAG TPA: HAMP domain-containing sensor histidine kinase [Acidothermaceae bacterium]
MTKRAAWRIQTLAATAVGGVVLLALGALAGTYLVFTQLARTDQASLARMEASEVAASLAVELPHDLTETSLRAQSSFFADERVLVTTPTGSFSFGSQVKGRTVTVTAPGTGGTVTVISPVEPENALPLQLTGITAGVLALVGAAATVVAWQGTGRLRHKLERASAAAERLSSGDLSVRLEEGGPAEVAALGYALNAMAAQLSAADIDQKQFLTDLAHEIATPFQIVAGLAQALLDGTIEPSNDVELSQVVSQETARLARLLDDLRALTRPDLVPDFELVALDALCASLVKRFTPLATTKGIRLKSQTHHVKIVTALHLVETVVSNFLTNALRATPAGGEVAVAVRRTRQGAAISVSDTGPGIPMSEQQRIFDRFYRLDRSRDRASGGSGLGLSIARRYAHALGGSIRLESAVGNGSRFTLELRPRTGADDTAPVLAE